MQVRSIDAAASADCDWGIVITTATKLVHKGNQLLELHKDN